MLQCAFRERAAVIKIYDFIVVERDAIKTFVEAYSCYSCCSCYYWHGPLLQQLQPLALLATSHMGPTAIQHSGINNYCQLIPTRKSSATERSSPPTISVADTYIAFPYFLSPLFLFSDTSFLSLIRWFAVVFVSPMYFVAQAFRSFCLDIIHKECDTCILAEPISTVYIVSPQFPLSSPTVNRGRRILFVKVVNAVGHGGSSSASSCQLWQQQLCYQSSVRTRSPIIHPSWLPLPRQYVYYCLHPLSALRPIMTHGTC